MGLLTSTPLPSAHDRVVRRGWGLQPQSRGPEPHLHKRCRDRGSVGRQVSDCETCFLGRVCGVWEGRGRAEPPCRPFPAPTPHPALGTPGRPQGGCATRSEPRPWRRPAGQCQPTSQQAVLRPVGASQPLGQQGFTQHAGVRGAQPHGCSGPSSCCDWRESSCSFSASQSTTTPRRLRCPSVKPREDCPGLPFPARGKQPRGRSCWTSPPLRPCRHMAYWL